MITGLTPANERVRILLVEDSPSDAALLREMLEEIEQGRFQFTRAERLNEALARLQTDSFDVLLLDLSLPDSTGSKTYLQARAAAPALPIVLLTGIDDEVIGIEAVRSGIQDYLVKGQADGRQILRAIRYAIERKQAEHKLQCAQAELERKVEERTEELHRINQALEHRSTQLRRLAVELIQAEERERRRLAQAVHDQLQPLLVGTKYCAQILRKRTKVKTFVKLLESLDEFLDESLNVARLLTYELSPPILYDGGLADALTWLGRWMQTRHGLTVHVQVDPLAEPTSHEVRIQLFQAVRELLWNVVKHAQVKTAQVETRRRTGDQIEIAVSDQGAGFDPVQRQSDKMSAGGFGLFSIRERLDWLGGHMEIHSAPGQGSRFTLVAPMNRAEILAATWAKPALPPARPRPSSVSGAARPLAGGRKIRVLLVDDQVPIRQGMFHLLGLQPDLEVVGEAADGIKALELARELEPDIVLMDVNMPRLNGVEATRRLTVAQPQVKVIGVSMHEESGCISAMREAGAVAFLDKAQIAETLVATIRLYAGHSNDKPVEVPPGSSGLAENASQ